MVEVAIVLWLIGWLFVSGIIFAVDANCSPLSNPLLLIFTSLILWPLVLGYMFVMVFNIDEGYENKRAD